MGLISSAKVQSLAAPWAGQVSSGQHQLLTDKPASFGGGDTGLAPYDFICTGLISCTMITLRMYAQHKGLALGEFSIQADFHANKEGREWIERRVHFENQLGAELEQKVLDICSKTPVTKTLLRSLEIQTSLI